MEKYVVYVRRKRIPENVDIFDRSVKIPLVVCSRNVSRNVNQIKHDDDRQQHNVK